jgi:hypothetical protein
MCGFDSLVFRASRSARAITFASRKSRMRAPLHRRTEKIGACIADLFANGEGAGVEQIDTLDFPRRFRREGCDCADHERRFSGLNVQFGFRRAALEAPQWPL